MQRIPGSKNAELLSFPTHFRRFIWAVAIKQKHFAGSIKASQDALLLIYTRRKRMQRVLIKEGSSQWHLRNQQNWFCISQQQKAVAVAHIVRRAQKKSFWQRTSSGRLLPLARRVCIIKMEMDVGGAHGPSLSYRYCK